MRLRVRLKTTVEGEAIIYSGHPTEEQEYTLRLVYWPENPGIVLMVVEGTDPVTYSTKIVARSTTAYLRSRYLESLKKKHPRGKLLYLPEVTKEEMRGLYRPLLRQISCAEGIRDLKTLTQLYDSLTQLMEDKVTVGARGV